MLKNRIVPALALAGLIGIAACEPRDDVRVDETQEVPPPATVEEPVTSPAEPLREDTLLYEEGVPQEEQDPAAPGEPGAPRVP